MLKTWNEQHFMNTEKASVPTSRYVWIYRTYLLFSNMQIYEKYV